MGKIAGTKGNSGLWQRIISAMPEHAVYIEPFWGRGTIAKKKLPAAITIGVDRDPEAIEDGREFGAKMFQQCGIAWLRDYFHATQVSSTRASNATFGGWAPEDHFVYIDPPYFGVPDYYKFSMTQLDHIELCGIFLALNCPAALSGYRSELYAAELSDCRSIDVPTVNRAGRACIETVWFNYPEPRRFHDVRFVGNGRRERERISRRVRNWKSGFSAMSPAEQQAVLNALMEVME